MRWCCAAVLLLVVAAITALADASCTIEINGQYFDLSKANNGQYVLSRKAL